jgi:hypothetical protein
MGGQGDHRLVQAGVPTRALQTGASGLCVNACWERHSQNPRCNKHSLNLYMSLRAIKSILLPLPLLRLG